MSKRIQVKPVIFIDGEIVKDLNTLGMELIDRLLLDISQSFIDDDLATEEIVKRTVREFGDSAEMLKYLWKACEKCEFDTDDLVSLCYEIIELSLRIEVGNKDIAEVILESEINTDD